MQKWAYILFLVMWATAANGQFLEVETITIVGNKRTKEKIVLREVDFRVGTRIQQSQLADRLKENERLILRTGLFTDAHINVTEWNTDTDKVSVEIEVTETPKIIPFPKFELADRNFNVWWNEYNASLKRVNYGGQLILLNAWGYGERFKINAQGGYTPRFELSALLPFIGYSQAVRLEVDISYSQNREISMYTFDNKQTFLEKDGSTIFRRQAYAVGALIRQDIYTHHTLRLGWNNNWIDSVFTAEVNPDFFLDGRTRQRYIFFEYQLDLEYRDLPVLPSKGWRAYAKFRKLGFGTTNDVSATYINPLFEINFPITDKLSVGTTLSGQIALERQKQPFFNYRGLGYDDFFVRGYELYVVDALDYFLSRNQVRYRVFSTVVNWKKIMPVKSLRIMPLQIYVAGHYDLGYANDPFYFDNNSFTNRWLYGGGLALNFLFFNTYAIQVEWSVNHLGEKGIFLHANSAF